MKPIRLLLLAALAALALPASASEAGFKSLFDGKTLKGWAGLEGYWSVRDGAITGQTTAEKPLKTNSFLVYQDAQPANFELRVMFKLTPNNDKDWGNSGVQYRSKVVDAAGFVVAGYQADIDSNGRYTGMLYEEKGRGILMNPGEKIKIGATTADPANAKKKKTAIEKLPGATPAADIMSVYKLGQWNELRIIAQGNHVQHFINGKLTADVTDNDPELAPKSGVIGLQIHTGQPMTIQFRHIELKELK